MGVKHKACINIAKPGGTLSLVVRSGTVQTVESHELKGGENHDKR